MSVQNLDLTGTWDGIYFYNDLPEAGPDTPFFATIKELNGSLTGTIIEPHEFTQATIMATILGRRSGQDVAFSKDYEDPDEDYLATVQYAGTLSSDGDVITGEWSIGHWKGWFEMTRTPSVAEKVSREERAWVEFDG